MQSVHKPQVGEPVALRPASQLHVDLPTCDIATSGTTGVDIDNQHGGLAPVPSPTGDGRHRSAEGLRYAPNSIDSFPQSSVSIGKTSIVFSDFAVGSSYRWYDSTDEQQVFPDALRLCFGRR